MEQEIDDLDISKGFVSRFTFIFSNNCKNMKKYSKWEKKHASLHL